MKKLISQMAMAMLCLVLFITACSKTGPTGATGPAGAAGPAGPTGPQGPIGVANIKVDTFTVANAGWLWNSGWYYSTGPGSYTEWFTRYHDVTLTAVTKGILDTGMVLMYIQPNSVDTNQWVPMPYSFVSSGNAYSLNFAFETSPGKVRLHYWYLPVAGSIPTTLSTDVVPTHKYKIFVIASGAVVTSMRREKVDTADYGTVSKFLGL